MGKRVDNNDATQEVSASMLVPPKSPPKSPYPGIPQNDASMWLSQPVNPDDFVSAPKRPSAPTASKSSNWIVAISAAVFVAVVGAGVWYAFLRETPAQTSAAAASGSATAAATAGTAAPAKVATATADAGAAGAASGADATVATATPDAGAAPTVGGLQVDAISAADPVTKKSTKRPATKKAVKKKTATASKKKKRR